MTRLAATLRKNQDFLACTQWLDEHGYPWDVQPAPGRGHPRLVVTTPTGRVTWPLASTPRGGRYRGGRNSAARLAQIVRARDGT